MTTTLRSQAGFTLIELVIAMSIAALLSVMLLGGYTFASRAWNRAEAADDASSEVFGAQSVLRRAFAGLSLDPQKMKFTGNAATFALMSQFALPGDAPASTAIGLAVETCPEGHCLVLVLSRPNPATPNGAAQAVSTPLVRGVASAAIAYRGRGDDAPWQSEWPGDNGAPSLVRIDVAFAGRSAQRWPTLYLATPGPS